MNDRAEFLPLAAVIDAVEGAHRRAHTTQTVLRVFRLSVELPVFVEERGSNTFVRLPRTSDSRAAFPPARLRISIGPEGDRKVSVEPFR